MSITALAARSDRDLSSLVPFTSCLTSTDILTKSSDIVRTWRIAGLPFETISRADIDRDVNALHSFLYSLAEEPIGIYQHTVQRKCKAPDLLPSISNDFAREVCAAHQKGLENADFFVLDLYLTVVYRCGQSNDDGAISSGVFNLFKKATGSDEEIRRTHQEGLDAMIKISRSLESGLAAYGPELMGDYIGENGLAMSDPLRLQNYLLTGFWEPTPRPVGVPLWNHLGSGTYTPGLDLVALQSCNDTRYAQMIEIKTYAPESYAGMLDELQKLGVEFVSCVAYCGLHGIKASDKLRDQASYHRQVNDHVSADECDEIRAGIKSGHHGVGELTVTIRVMADTPQRTRDDTSKVVSVLRHVGMKPKTARRATASAFFSQVPGNFWLRNRIPMKTSRNLADFMPMHKDYTGKARGNPWGDALMPIVTPSRRVAFLNLHHVQSSNDAKGSKPPGSTVMLGKNGKGKTTLLNLINLYSMRFHNMDDSLLSLTLDIKQGSRPTIEAMGGTYSALKNGHDTGYNPFKMDATPDNIVFLDHLVTHLCSQDGNRVSTSDIDDIEQAVRAVMRLPKADRGFTLLLQCLRRSQGGDSLHSRLAKWATDDSNGRVGSHAWVMDSENDSLDFDAGNVFGIDGTDLLENATTRTPVLMYILYRVKQALGTRRVSILIDEFWQWLGNADISDWIEATLATIRSKDGIVVLATQMPESILESKAGTAVVMQAATFIFLGNERALFDVYKRFGMTKTEFKALLNLPPYHFIYKQDDVSFTAQADISALSAHHREVIAG